LFNPEESIELQGNTGPFIQYTYARIQSMLRKADAADLTAGARADAGLAAAVPKLSRALEDPELAVLALIQRFPAVIQEAAAHYSPAEVANYAYELAKAFNQFYDKLSVLRAPEAHDRQLRLAISALTGDTLRRALGILGVDVPERM